MISLNNKKSFQPIPKILTSSSIVLNKKSKSNFKTTRNQI